MNAILSIKPKFADAIFSGQKKYEYRKIFFKKKVDRIYLYASSPVREIVGEICIGDIIADSPSTIWDLTNSASGITKEYFDNYFQDKETGYAMSIISYHKYEKAINPNSIIKNFKAPQSYIYIDLELNSDEK